MCGIFLLPVHCSTLIAWAHRHCSLTLCIRRLLTCSLVGLYQCASGAAVYPGKLYFQMCVGCWWQNQKILDSTKAIPFEMLINHLHLQSSRHISQSILWMEFLHLSGSSTWDIPWARLNFSVTIRYVELGCLYTCVVSGFRREVDKNCALLGFYPASSGNSLPNFRGNLPVPSSPDVSGQPTGSHLQVSTLEDVTDRLSRNVGKELLLLAA